MVGGETAEMPGTYAKGKFDIAGFAVGIVDQKNIIKKQDKKERSSFSCSIKWSSFKWVFFGEIFN